MLKITGVRLNYLADLRRVLVKTLARRNTALKYHGLNTPELFSFVTDLHHKSHLQQKMTLLEEISETH
jgi:hypothetical protein